MKTLGNMKTEEKGRTMSITQEKGRHMNTQEENEETQINRRKRRTKEEP